MSKKPQLQKLTSAATDMMQGDANAAKQWLQEPREIFKGQSAIEHAVTDDGYKEVLDLIGRIRHGVFP